MYNFLGRWTMFSTSPEEVSQLLVKLGDSVFEQDGILFENYPFAPSFAYTHKKVYTGVIIDVDVSGMPPTIRVGNELLFVSATKKEELTEWATTNNIPVVKRDDLWGWLLEPFLDTEYLEDMHERLKGLLAKYGLAEPQVTAIRDEVAEQMLKYNFDTMLWDWVHLGAMDVLSAMRTKYSADQYADFYKRAMQIALLEPLINNQA